MNLDWLNNLYNQDTSKPAVKVTGLPFSGMFVGDITDYDGSQESEDCVQTAFDLWSHNSTYALQGFDNCVEQFPFHIEGCLREDLLFQAIDTPAFLVEEQYDTSGIYGFRHDQMDISMGLDYAKEYGY